MFAGLKLDRLLVQSAFAGPVAAVTQKRGQETLKSFPAQQWVAE